MGVVLTVIGSRSVRRELGPITAARKSPLMKKKAMDQMMSANRAVNSD